jgi:hypothetical protein
MRLAAIVFVAALCVAPALAQDAGFRPLTEWRAWRGIGIPPQWTISNGVIEHQPGGGDLVSVETFHNFELSFDWRISAGGNSGVIYRSSEDYSLPYSSGPEYQVLDNATAEGGNDPLQQAAGCYGLYAPTAAPKPAGEWNSARIVVNGNHVEHWLNGQEVVDYEIASADWTQRVAHSKFASWPEYGTIATGHIDLQDHGSPVAYRNLMIKVLPD